MRREGKCSESRGEDHPELKLEEPVALSQKTRALTGGPEGVKACPGGRRVCTRCHRQRTVPEPGCRGAELHQLCWAASRVVCLSRLREGMGLINEGRGTHIIVSEIKFTLKQEGMWSGDSRPWCLQQISGQCWFPRLPSRHGYQPGGMSPSPDGWR